MQCLTIVSILLYLSTRIDAGALKCNPDSQDPACTTKNREISAPQQLVEREGSSEAQCAAGSAWESHCHRCRCSDDGVAICTKIKACSQKTDAAPLRCKPRSTFKRDCNTCVCLEDGSGLCTLRQCLDRDKRQAGECEPGTSFKLGCNTCHCDQLGRAQCTRRGCLEGINPRTKRDAETTRDIAQTINHFITKRAVCKPNQEFKAECNMCQCSPSGQSYTCTHNECFGDLDNTNKEVEVFMESGGSDHIEQAVCKPLTEFYVDCNTCTCDESGLDYTCTDKPCPLPEDVEVFRELKDTSTKSPAAKVVCVANRMFIRDCNTCWCNADGTSFFCTRRVCIEKGDDNNTRDPMEELELRKYLKECVPNSVFEMECNMCRCEPDGKSFSCTRRACLEPDDKEDSEDKDKNASSLDRKARGLPEQPKTCQPGQEFRMDCNKCLCNDEGQDFSCTRMDCAALNSNGGVDSFAGARTKRDASSQVVPSQCVPDSVFARECNTCLCTKDGMHATCTLKRCRHEDERDATATDTTPSFRCTPGDQFKENCNDCSCQADGKNIFCTLRLCDDFPQ